MNTRMSEPKGQNKSVCTVNAYTLHAHWLLCSLESLHFMLGCLSFINLPLGGARVEQKTMTHEEVQKGLRHDTQSTVFNVWIFQSLWWIMMNLRILSFFSVVLLIKCWKMSEIWTQEQRPFFWVCRICLTPAGRNRTHPPSTVGQQSHQKEILKSVEIWLIDVS